MKAEGRDPKAEGGPKGRRAKAEAQGLVFIALGSNLGDARSHVLQAMDRLEGFSTAPLLRSSLWQSAPVDCPLGSPPFVNAVVALVPQAGETPESLLEKLQALEKAFGRRPKQVLNEPRPLDLDLLAFGSETRATARLTLPHPRAHERGFVLQPLNELAPELVLPGQSRTVAELLARLSAGSGCQPLGSSDARFRD